MKDGDTIPSTMEGIAAVLGVTSRTLRNWKNDKAFKAVWEKEAAEVVGGVDKRQEVLEELRALALLRGYDGPDGHVPNLKQVPSAGLYLKAIGAIVPVKAATVDEATRAVTAYSDDELNALIAEEAQKLIVGRRVAPSA